MASVTPLPATATPDPARALGMHLRLDLDETLAALLADHVDREPRRVESWDVMARECVDLDLGISVDEMAEIVTDERLTLG